MFLDRFYMNSNIAQWMCRRVFIRMWSRTWCIGLTIRRARPRLSLVVGGLLLLSYMNREKGTRDLMSILPSSQAIVTSVLMCRRSEWSSFNEHFPRVIAQTYLFDHAIKDLTSTTTRHGITSRDLLVATTNQLISLPKRLLDPRRPVIPPGGKLKSDDKEEGLLAYDAVIPDERKWTISHINEVLL